MAFENFPTAESAPPTPPNRSDWRTLLSIVLVIALLTVSYQGVKTAFEKPVVHLRND